MQFNHQLGKAGGSGPFLTPARQRRANCDDVKALQGGHDLGGGALLPAVHLVPMELADRLRSAQFQDGLPDLLTTLRCYDNGGQDVETASGVLSEALVGKGSKHRVTVEAVRRTRSN